MRFVHLLRKPRPRMFLARVWMLALRVPDIGDYPNLKVVQPKRSPRYDCAGNCHRGSPETASGKIETKTLRFLIVNMRKFSATRKLLEIGFAHPNLWTRANKILKFDCVIASELAWANRSSPK